MDIQTLMPLLMNLLGGGNNPLQNLLNQKPSQQPQPQNIPQEVLASYPSSYTQSASNSKSPQDQRFQESTSQNQQNLPNFDMLKNLMPLLQNTNKQKNSPLIFSELKSVDEYTF